MGCRGPWNFPLVGSKDLRPENRYLSGRRFVWVKGREGQVEVVDPDEQPLFTFQHLFHNLAPDTSVPELKEKTFTTTEGPVY